MNKLRNKKYYYLENLIDIIFVEVILSRELNDKSLMFLNPSQAHYYYLP